MALAPVQHRRQAARQPLPLLLPAIGPPQSHLLADDCLLDRQTHIWRYFADTRWRHFRDNALAAVHTVHPISFDSSRILSCEFLLLKTIRLLATRLKSF